ncbi:MAG: hypothetical protein OQK35_01965 [Alphaproteobacteria bacterium]|nr:hypothetical protein [Rhodospirillales bacterium]MCW9045075.1 hypothetical protein [Alphaproteobacteria bacterium]
MTNQKPFRGNVKCESVITNFVTILGKEAQANQGSLTMAQIEAISQKYISGDDLHAFHESCLNEFSAMQHDEHRKDIIGRLLVQRFVKLLSQENNPEPNSKELSRWIIPEFLSLIKMMVGEVNYEKYNQRARQRLTALKEKLQKPSVWDEFFTTERARLITDDILVDVAMIFDPFEQRRDWFVNVIDTKLKEHPLTEDDHPQRGRWLYQNRHFYYMVDALFKRIRAKLSDKEQQQFLADRYGMKVGQLITLFKKLNQGKKDAMARKQTTS